MNLTNFTSTLDEVDQTNNLKIIIGGLALSYFDMKSNQWKIFFPKAPNHNFKMIIRKRDLATGKVIEQNTFELFTANEEFFTAGKIEVITNQKSGGSVFEPDLLKKTLDLSELHGEALHLTSDKRKYAGFLLLNEARLADKTDSESVELEIWKVEPFPNPKSKEFIEKRTAGMMFDCGFRFEPGSKTEIRIESKLGFSVMLNHQENISHEIVFDNDCHKENTPCAESDFKFYYKIIDEDKLQVKRRFELIPVSIDDKAPVGSCVNGIVKNLIIPDGLIITD